jgi:outer membrane murein-binding lipoprotein Lpp
MTEIGQPLRSSDTSMKTVTLKPNATTIGQQYSQTILNVNEIRSDLNDDTKHGLQHVDSEDIPSTEDLLMNSHDATTTTTQIPFYKQLIQRMNPSECISPTIVTAAQASVTAVQGCTSTAYKSCVATDREELEYVLPDLLNDIRYKNSTSVVSNRKAAARTAALQRLYRLTDREHAHNR